MWRTEIGFLAVYGLRRSDYLIKKTTMFRVITRTFYDNIKKQRIKSDFHHIQYGESNLSCVNGKYQEKGVRQ